MRSAKPKRELVRPPVVGPGNWKSEILDGYTFSFGQAVQDGPPRRSVEFSYIIMQAIFTSPEARFGVAKHYHDLRSNSHEAGVIRRWTTS
jgi:hypothetical protein